MRARSPARMIVVVAMLLPGGCGVRPANVSRWATALGIAADLAPMVSSVEWSSPWCAGISPDAAVVVGNARAGLVGGGWVADDALRAPACTVGASAVFATIDRAATAIELVDGDTIVGTLTGPADFLDVRGASLRPPAGPAFVVGDTLVFELSHRDSVVDAEVRFLVPDDDGSLRAEGATAAVVDEGLATLIVPATAAGAVEIELEILRWEIDADCDVPDGITCTLSFGRAEEPGDPVFAVGIPVDPIRPR